METAAIWTMAISVSLVRLLGTPSERWDRVQIAKKKKKLTQRLHVLLYFMNIGSNH